MKTLNSLYVKADKMKTLNSLFVKVDKMTTNLEDLIAVRIPLQNALEEADQRRGLLTKGRP